VGGAGGSGAISISAGVRVLLTARLVDFRRDLHCLSALVAERQGEGPFSGAVIVFRTSAQIGSRTRSEMAAVWWGR
jgi:hypothetical protein